MRVLEVYGDAIKELDAFIRELDPSIRLETFSMLFAMERKEGAAGDARSRVASIDVPRKLSPQELIHTCGASSLMDKAVVLGYWLEQHQGNDSFTSADLKNAFVSAREPAPVNPSDVVARLEGGRKLMRAEKTGKAQSYRLTRTAMNEVESWVKTGSAES